MYMDKTTMHVDNGAAKRNASTKVVILRSCSNQSPHNGCTPYNLLVLILKHESHSTKTLETAAQITMIKCAVPDNDMQQLAALQFVKN